MKVETLALLVCALGGCDPGRFDHVAQVHDAAVDPSHEAGSDAGADLTDAMSGGPTGSGAIDGGPALSLEAGPGPAADSGPSAPDGGPGASPDAGLPTCSAPPPAGRPLAFSANVPRVVARVRNPPAVDLQRANSIRPIGDQLLWTLLTTTTNSPGGYGTIARSAAAGPWAAPPESWPQAIELTVQAGPDGAPMPLLPASFTVPAVSPVGAIARGAEAVVYFKRYYGFFGTEIYLGQLTADAYALASDPVRLFESTIDPPGRAPLFGNGAYERGGTVYTLACQLELTMTPFRPCALARASAMGAASKASYEAYQSSAGGPGAWTRDLAAASDIFETGDDTISLSFNAYLGKWLLITAARADDGRGNGSVLVRAAVAPQGPWTEQTTIRVPDSPEGIPARYPIEQPDLAQNCGQRLMLSYVEPSLEFTNSLGLPQVSHGRVALIAFDLQ
jgi:hypothetical protein